MFIFPALVVVFPGINKSCIIVVVDVVVVVVVVVVVIIFIIVIVVVVVVTVIVIVVLFVVIIINPVSTIWIPFRWRGEQKKKKDVFLFL